MVTHVNLYHEDIRVLDDLPSSPRAELIVDRVENKIYMSSGESTSLKISECRNPDLPNFREGFFPSWILRGSLHHNFLYTYNFISRFLTTKLRKFRHREVDNQGVQRPQHRPSVKMHVAVTIGLQELSGSGILQSEHQTRKLRQKHCKSHVTPVLSYVTSTSRRLCLTYTNSKSSSRPLRSLGSEHSPRVTWWRVISVREQSVHIRLRSRFSVRRGCQLRHDPAFVSTAPLTPTRRVFQFELRQGSRTRLAFSPSMRSFFSGRGISEVSSRA